MSNVLGNMPPVFGSGYRGVVPAPTAADVSAQNILRADGTWAAGPSGTLPSQTSNFGKVLTTDGTNASWTNSPTFGGNLTVSGTGTSSMAGRLDIANSVSENTAFQAVNSSATGYGALISGGDSTRYCFKVVSQAGGIMINTLNTGTTLGGNLTVSGTGGSTFNAASVSTPSSAYQANQAFRIISTTTAEVQQAFLSGGNFGYYIQVGGSSTYPLMLQPSGSNVLLGTTTDTGEKLQVNGSAYFAGTLIQLGAGSYDATYRVSGSTGKSTDFGNDATGGYIKANNSQSLRVITGATTAITLSGSDQSATFEGTVTVSGSGSSDGVSCNAFFGGTKRLILGYDQTNDYATLSAVHTGVNWKPISIQGAGGNVLVGKTSDNGEKLQLSGKITTQNGTAYTPSTASASGAAGTIAWDASYIYICTATNTWKRAAIATW